MSRRDYKTVNVTPDLHQRMRVASAELGIPVGSMVEQAWELYMRRKDKEQQMESIPAPVAKSPYLAHNQRWHNILEQVLNDPDEALGIQKNLEWAERTVQAKPPPKKRANGS